MKKYALLALMMIVPQTEKACDNPIINIIGGIFVFGLSGLAIYAWANSPYYCTQCHREIPKNESGNIPASTIKCCSRGHYFHTGCYNPTHCSACFHSDVLRAEEAARRAEAASREAQQTPVVYVIETPQPQPIIVHQNYGICTECNGTITMQQSFKDRYECGHRVHIDCYFRAVYSCRKCNEIEAQKAEQTKINAALAEQRRQAELYAQQQERQRKAQEQANRQEAADRRYAQQLEAKKQEKIRLSENKAQELARQEAGTASTKEALAMQRAAEESIKTANQEKAHREAQEQSNRNAHAQKQAKQSICAYCNLAFVDREDRFELVPFKKNVVCEHVVHKACAKNLVKQLISECPKCHNTFQINTLAAQLRSIA